MAFSVSDVIHSPLLKDIILSFLAAGKQIGDEAIAAGATQLPALQIIKPLFDSEVDALVARTQHLERNQEAKAAAVAAVAPESATATTSDPVS